jgi:SWI/SNF-related matrix-associated actin-dependent regulator of chromatin subfamily A-like protein 1
LPNPLPHQIVGARFLAQRDRALLADQPRVGKTGAAIMAADMVAARRILVVTTASGRGVWVKAFKDWSSAGRSVQIMLPANVKTAATADVVVVGWPSVATPAVCSALSKIYWDVVILDESHNAKNSTAKRTRAVYGFGQPGVIDHAAAVWCLSGTPMPHNPSDLYPMLKALSPDRLTATGDAPGVSNPDDFLHRYCVVRMKKISNFNRIPVVVGSRNLEELRARLDGFMLRRTQEDVGIRPPVFETLPVIVSDRLLREFAADLDAEAVLAAAASGSTRELEMHLGPMRRITGEAKAHAVVEAVHDEMAGGLDKIVLMFWHRGVGDILQQGLAKLGVARIDGSTTDREAQVQAFQEGSARVFLGQIQAAGEAIDLSAAAVLWFVESSFTPKDMAQAALRITNHEQKRQAFVKVVTLQGSIDEALQARLMMLWTSIREVLKK